MNERFIITDHRCTDCKTRYRVWDTYFECQASPWFNTRSAAKTAAEPTRAAAYVKRFQGRSITQS